jgi:hypothetical protein
MNHKNIYSMIIPLFFKGGMLRRSRGVAMASLLFILILASPAQTPKVDTLFNFATGTDFGSDGDSIEYRKIGRNNTNGVVEFTVKFDDLNCSSTNAPKLAIGKSLEEGEGGIFPESFSTDFPNPMVLDTAAVSTVTSMAGQLKYRLYDEIGDVWNFNVKFTDWNSYYLVFILDEVGTCTTGKIWIIK